jgi:hypothetical protein
MGCAASVPVAPKFDSLPPELASLNLQIRKFEPAFDIPDFNIILEALRPALMSALSTAGFNIVDEPASMDASVDISLGGGGSFSSSPYRTILTLHGPHEREIEEIEFTGGNAMWSLSDAEVVKKVARGIAANLVVELQRSPKLLAFAHEPRVKHVPTAAAPAPAGAIRSDVDSPQERLGEDSDDFAVVVGIEKYSNDLPDAQFAEHDARAVKNHLLALGYPERNIKFLTGQRATLSGLASYIEDWLPRNVKDDSRVFFYFSGHGAPDPDSGQAYLVPSDGDPNFLDKSAYPLKRLYSNLNALKAKQVIVALDSCFSGAGGRSVMAKGTRPLVNKIDIDLASDGKLILFAASSAKETSSTLEDQGHGIFTYYFLKGLGGEAKDGSGVISARGLYDYLKPKVQDAASRQNRDQTPVLEGAGQDSELARFNH